MKKGTTSAQPSKVELPKKSVTNQQSKKTESTGQKKQKVDYDGTSYCRNRGPYAECSRCLANKSDCRFYEMMLTKSGEKVGACKKRYDAKQQKKRQQEADIKHTQDISTYNGRGH